MMPVQINEIVIKVVVDSSPAAHQESGVQVSGAGSSATATEAELAAMVLEIIKEKKER